MTRDVVLAVWSLLAVGLLSSEVAAVSSRGRMAGFGGVLGALAGRRWSLVVCFVAWMWVGWHFFAR